MQERGCRVRGPRVRPQPRRGPRAEEAAGGEALSWPGRLGAGTSACSSGVLASCSAPVLLWHLLRCVEEQPEASSLLSRADLTLRVPHPRTRRCCREPTRVSARVPGRGPALLQGLSWARGRCCSCGSSSVPAVAASAVSLRQEGPLPPVGVPGELVSAPLTSHGRGTLGSGVAMRPRADRIGARARLAPWPTRSRQRRGAAGARGLPAGDLGGVTLSRCGSIPSWSLCHDSKPTGEEPLPVL